MNLTKLRTKREAKLASKKVPKRYARKTFADFLKARNYKFNELGN